MRTSCKLLWPMLDPLLQLWMPALLPSEWVTACCKLADQTNVYFLVHTQYYSGGVYSSIRCSRTSMNHAVLVTGFGNYNGKEYYLVKNRCNTNTYQHANQLRKIKQTASKQAWFLHFSPSLSPSFSLLCFSWSKDWGVGGYIMMSRNSYNQCGIATDASYPSLWK